VSDEQGASGSAVEPVERVRPQGTPPPDSPELRPLLGESQLTALGNYGAEVEISAGDVLFADGDQTYDLIVVLEGTVEIVEHFGKSTEDVVISYGAREFLGEIGLLTGQRVFLTAVARAAGRVLRVPVEQLRIIMAQEADLSEYILRAMLVRHARLTQRGSGLTLVGSRFDRNTRGLLEVLARNRIPHRWLELEGSAEAEETLRQLDVPLTDLPLVVVPGDSLLRNPSSQALLDALGLAAKPRRDRNDVCDLLVVGAGPAGLAAAVYGGSEGMSTVLAEATAIGGQAGTSSRIENYLGFPAGLSGEELAERAALQADKFGVRMKLGSLAVSLSSDGDSHHVEFEDGEVLAAKSLILATGARYNRLPLDRLSDFEGVGVYYAATQMEAQACAPGPVVIVGGGNSAGQGALFLARACTRVQIVIRGATLSNSMSRYLIDQIERDPRITVSPHTEVVGLVGEQRLEGVTLRESASGRTFTQPSRGLFVFIGATPSTDWLNGQLAVDDHGFLLTGSDVPMVSLENPAQTPLLLETSRPGVFCVGDVRSRSIKRVATAIGEGSMAVRLVFERLETTGRTVAEAVRI
jgi:thioredoxin reductase (NADPH)